MLRNYQDDHRGVGLTMWLKVLKIHAGHYKAYGPNNFLSYPSHLTSQYSGCLWMLKRLDITALLLPSIPRNPPR